MSYLLDYNNSDPTRAVRCSESAYEAESSMSEPIIKKDVTLCNAMFITGDPFFSSRALIWYDLDLSNKQAFISSIRNIISNKSLRNDLEDFNNKFGNDAKGIIYILDQLIRDDRYERLKISQLKKIIIRSANSRAVVISNNNINNDNRILVFDIGTVMRMAHDII
jgi:hypothetical protein